MVDGSALRRGMVLKLEGELYVVTDYQHVKPGKGPAYMQAAMKSLKSGRILRQRFRSSDNLEQVYLDSRRMQFLYADDTHLHFMDQSDYETVAIEADVIGDARYYVTEGMVIDVGMHEGQAISFDLPTSVVLEIAETDPGIKGDTVSAATKPAKTVTGLVVQVPLFVNRGERIKVDTRTGEYLGRS
ncbi:MAG: elongation factor P [Verrucomicrobia bacterium]|nr:elongation factor P [Verrucomicrobiota bacterium]